MSNQIDQIDSVALSMSRNDATVVKQQTNGGESILRNKKTQDKSSNDILEGSNSEIKSKRPKKSPLKQQQLPAWQPILTSSTVLPLFFIIGAVFIVIGSVLLYYSNSIQEFTYDYTNCNSSIGGGSCSSIVNSSNITSTCTCTIKFALTSSFPAPVYIYYGLTNFYQNHRRYVKSRDDNQLLGQSVTSYTVNSDCSPYSYDNTSSSRPVYAPCGAIANSLFNDQFTISYIDVSTTIVPLIKTGIAWTSDKNVKFENPSSWNNTIKPPRWRQNVTMLDTSDATNNGYKNEDLIVWMRTAALPNFRKFYRIVNTSTTPFTSGLPAGSYSLNIAYNFPVTEFSGTKSFIISTTSWIGGKNSFLGIAYLVIGVLCILLGVIFLIIHLVYGKKINDDFNASKNNND